MNLPMRINFDNKDYSYLIITNGINKLTTKIQINLNDKEYLLVCNSTRHWDFVDATVNDLPRLFQ